MSTTAPAAPAKLTVREVARRENTTTRTIYREIRAGRLRAVRVGSQWRVSVADLENYLARGDVR